VLVLIGFLGGAFILVFAVAMTKSAVQEWKGQGASFSSVMVRGGMDPVKALSYSRAILPLAVIFGTGALMLFGLGVTGLGGDPIGPIMAVAGFGGFLLAGALLVIIRVFNQPKILFPPPLRREPGVLAQRRRSGGPRNRR